MPKAIEVKAELFPIKIFAARLGVSVWTARGWCYRGRVASVKIGAKLLVPTGEVESSSPKTCDRDCSTSPNKRHPR